MSAAVKNTAVQRLTEKHSNLQSKQFVSWLDEPIFALNDAADDTVVTLSRRGVAILSESPCTNAAAKLHRACKQYKIRYIQQLFDIGLHGLLRCHGVGERTAWIAALLLEDLGYNVDRWIAFKPGRGVGRKGHIKLVHSRTSKQKH